MENSKQYNILLYNVVKCQNIDNIIKSIKNIENKDEFKTYLSNNIKKSSFLAQILPLFLFLLISLISLSVVILKQNKPNFWGDIITDDLIVPILGFGLVFLILGILLIIQSLIFKTKVIYLDNVYRKGFYNLSNNKYKKIINIIKDENK